MMKRMAVVLAAGKGTRMKSDLPKVLVPVCGRPMIDYVLDALEIAGIDRVLVVVGYRADLVRTALANRRNVGFVEQREQLGTGHAVMVCRDELQGHEGPVLIVTGDSPMIEVASVRALLDDFARTQPACLLGTTHKADPGMLGRIVRDAGGTFQAIVEFKDATDDQRRITEVNMSTYVFNNADLLAALGQLKNHNAQGEYYITDCPGLLQVAGREVRALPVLTPRESLSINTMEDLAEVERVLHDSHVS